MSLITPTYLSSNLEAVISEVLMQSVVNEFVWFLSN